MKNEWDIVDQDLRIPPKIPAERLPPHQMVAVIPVRPRISKDSNKEVTKVPQSTKIRVLQVKTRFTWPSHQQRRVIPMPTLPSLFPLYYEYI